MSIESIVGMIFSGIACRLYAGVTAVWMAGEAMKPLQQVADAFKHLP